MKRWNSNRWHRVNAATILAVFVPVGVSAETIPKTGFRGPELWIPTQD